jgi:hypothetical protein
LPTCDGFSGEATVVDADVNNVETVLVDTGPLPPSGGTIDVSAPNGTVPGALTADALVAMTTAQGNQSQSEASMANMVISISGVDIAADSLSSTATATCQGSTPVVTGDSIVANLTVGGMPVVVSGTPNQVVLLPLGLGQIVINEQSSSVGGGMGEITVSALHITITGVADIVLARSHADITCPRPTCTGFSGRGIGIDSTVSNVSTTLVDTGPLPASGGMQQASLPNASIPGVLTTGAIDAQTMGQGNFSTTTVSVSDLDLSVAGAGATGDMIASSASAECTPGGPVVDGDSTLTNLIVDGMPVVVSGSPNQVVNFTGYQIIINEQTSSVAGGVGEITVNALRVIVPDMADIIVASSHADITCGAAGSPSGAFLDPPG